MNGFSTEEDSHDAPPAPPFFGQSCCLIEDGERCGRAAGNASFSKRIQKSISQRKLKLDIDKSVRHLYICDFHKNFIQSVRNKRKRKTSDDGGESPDHDAEVPEVNQGSSASCCCSISASFVSQLLSRPYKILHYLVMYAAENLPQVTVHTDALVAVGLQFVSVLVNGADEALVPDLREEPYTQNIIEEFEDGQFEALLCVFQHLVQDAVNAFLGSRT
ncbi:uncharacterized protein LOC107657192, partial [Sinocyclocheilus anshuiensis]|uniref:uncharacterized protein LOC107657192 n=1 Tax=Sinocyclocheilus anshuiensis TaxID=1608454 RepID=UPI0007B944D4